YGAAAELRGYRQGSVAGATRRRRIELMERPMVVLETERLRLEPLTQDHASELFEPLRDKRLYRYYAGEPPASIAELQVRFSALESRRSPDGQQRWYNWVVRTRDGIPIGRMQATIKDTHAIIGYDIFVRFWRNGYGREAGAAMLDHLARECAVSVVRAVV